MPAKRIVCSSGPFLSHIKARTLKSTLHSPFRSLGNVSLTRARCAPLALYLQMGHIVRFERISTNLLSKLWWRTLVAFESIKCSSLVHAAGQHCSNINCGIFTFCMSHSQFSTESMHASGQRLVDEFSWLWARHGHRMSTELCTKISSLFTLLYVDSIIFAFEKVRSNNTELYCLYVAILTVMCWLLLCVCLFRFFGGNEHESCRAAHWSIREQGPVCACAHTPYVWERACVCKTWSGDAVRQSETTVWCVLKDKSMCALGEYVRRWGMCSDFNTNITNFVWEQQQQFLSIHFILYIYRIGCVACDEFQFSIIDFTRDKTRR